MSHLECQLNLGLIKLWKFSIFYQKTAYQKTSLQCEHWNGRKSRRLHDARLQCFPIESRSASSAMIQLYSKCSYSWFWSAVYIHFAESWFNTFPDSCNRKATENSDGHTANRWLVVLSLLSGSLLHHTPVEKLIGRRVKRTSVFYLWALEARRNKNNFICICNNNFMIIHQHGAARLLTAAGAYPARRQENGTSQPFSADIIFCSYFWRQGSVVMQEYFN